MTYMVEQSRRARLQLLRFRSFGVVGNSISIAAGVLTVELTLAPKLHWWWGDALHRVLLDAAGVVSLWFLVAIHEIAHGWFLTRRGPVELRITPAFGSARPTSSDHLAPVAILAGPLANLGFGLLLQSAILNALGSVPYVVALFGAWMAWISVVIGIVNLFPVFPLDGFRLLDTLIDRSSSSTAPVFRLMLNTLGFGLVLTGLIMSIQRMRLVSIVVLLVALIFATATMVKELIDAMSRPTTHTGGRPES